MHSFALYYFLRAAQLRPYDSRMWCALAESYERVDRVADAIRCYLRAESNQDIEDIALMKLAKLYARLGRASAAAQYYLKVVDKVERAAGDEQGLRQGQGRAKPAAQPDADLLEAYLFLAEFSKQQRNFAAAERYCKPALDAAGPLREQGRSLMKEIRFLGQAAEPKP
jgi:anaphase-promoting complex subunit 8